MNQKGQGALEYLLLIGGAIFVVAIVVSIIVDLPDEEIETPKVEIIKPEFDEGWLCVKERFTDPTSESEWVCNDDGTCKTITKKECVEWTFTKRKLIENYWK